MQYRNKTQIKHLILCNKIYLLNLPIIYVNLRIRQY